MDEKIYNKFSKIIDSRDDKPQKNLYFLFRISVISIVFITLFNIVFNNTDKLGEWGDFFGGVLNPILTFLTFMGLLITIILQQKELREARHEFEGQKNALVSQQKEMVKQTFDNKFFQMLNQFNVLISYIHSEKYQNKKGRSILSEINKELMFRFKNINCLSENFMGNYRRTYEGFNNKHDTTLKYYFINLYQVIKYVDQEIPLLSEAKKYTNIIRAQLSKDEIILLFYNSIGIMDISGSKYKKFIEKYSFFEHLKYEDLLVTTTNTTGVYKHKKELVDILLKLYKINAFGKNKKLIEKINTIQLKS